MLEDAVEAFNKAGNAYKIANLHQDVSSDFSYDIIQCTTILILINTFRLEMLI
jgi:hypothetical protein